MIARPAPIEVPNKQTFKPAEVCELLAIPAYVLRTWENEFKDLGESGASGGPRVYRRSDVELAVRIRELVFTEHLTLAGVRRKLEQESLLPSPDVEPAEAVVEASSVPTVRIEKLQDVKRELRELLQRLATDARQELKSQEAVDPSPPGREDVAEVTPGSDVARAQSAENKSTTKVSSRTAPASGRTSRATPARGKR